MKDSIVQPSISELLKIVNNKFSLVILSARVARHDIDKDKEVKRNKHINYLTLSEKFMKVRFNIRCLMLNKFCNVLR